MQSFSPTRHFHSASESGFRSLSAEEAETHERALLASKNFKVAEAELMEALIAADRVKVFRSLGYPSLFRYATEALGLSEGVAYSAITVARKAEVIPVLREAVNSGELSLSKAKKVASVLDSGRTAEENSEWVQKAANLSSRQIERAVAAERPQEAIPEKAIYKSARRLELVLGVSEEILLDFRKAQDRVATNRSRNASLEETLQEVLRFYLERKDPEERARRVIAKKGMRSQARPADESDKNAHPKQFTGTVRQPIPSAILHRVRFRDRGFCQHPMPNGKICGSRRWIEVHHRVPVSEGGENTLENLVLLCRAHHQGLHVH